MSKLATGLYVLAMIALIVTVDLAFMRGHFWWRLLANVSIAASFAALYLLVLRKQTGEG